MQVVNKSILSTVADELSGLALRRTAVLGDTLRGVEYHRGTGKIRYRDKLPGVVDILVLGKEHYREENRVFTLQSRSELGKILALESAANDAELMLYHIGDLVDGQRHVVLWYCATRLFADNGLKPLLIVPESLLLLASRPDRLVSVERQGKTFWFYHQSSGQNKAQGKYLSAVKQGLIANASLFKASAGLAEDVAHSEITGDDYPGVLLASFIPLLAGRFRGLGSGLRKTQVADLKDYGKYCGISAAALLLLYFSLTSGYLQWRLDNAQQVGSRFGEQTRGLFALKKQLTGAQQQQVQLAQVMSLTDAPSVVWRLLSPLVQQGVEIKRLNYLPEGLFIINGVANKDTEVLAFLNNDERVMQPQLRTATQTIKARDHFNIAFRIKGDRQ